MDLMDKARILKDVWNVFEDDERFDAMFTYANLGFPFAHGLAEGYILRLSPSGESFVMETWDYFCEFVQVDYDAEWNDLNHILSQSLEFMET